MVPKSRINSNFLYSISKLLVVVGALLVIAGAVLFGHTISFVSLELFGIVAIYASFLIRKKAATFRRRFEWREGHVEY